MRWRVCSFSVDSFMFPCMKKWEKMVYLPLYMYMSLPIYGSFSHFLLIGARRRPQSYPTEAGEGSVRLGCMEFL